MKLETLGEFITLVKSRSFSRAAKELFLSQPSLSTHISAMERELGFEVIDRSKNKLVLTPAGTMFLEYAQGIVNTYEEARSRGLEISKEQPPIKMSSVPLESNLFKALSVMDDPKITFVDIDFNTTLLDALADGTVDIGFTADYTNLPASCEKSSAANIAFVPTGTERAAIAVMDTHPLAHKNHLTKGDLEGMTITIGSYAHFDEWKHMVREMMGSDVRLNYHLVQRESTADLAREDLGNTLHICGRNAMGQYYGHRDDIVVFDQIDGQDLQYPWGIAYRADSSNEQLPAFVQKLKGMLQDA